MSKLDRQIKKIKAEGRMGLMTHVVVGYPTIEDTRTLVKMMAEEGADFIELQIPFSDPMGDGPTIHRANTAAIAGGVRVRDAFTLIRGLRDEDKIEIPLLLMTYVNIVYTYAFAVFTGVKANAIISNGHTNRIVFLSNIYYNFFGFRVFVDVITGFLENAV